MNTIGDARAEQPPALTTDSADDSAAARWAIETERNRTERPRLVGVRKIKGRLSMGYSDGSWWIARTRGGSRNLCGPAWVHRTPAVVRVGTRRPRSRIARARRTHRARAAATSGTGSGGPPSPSDDPAAPATPGEHAQVEGGVR
jgi:hypothetical protein